jgi:hypothetical protein
VTTPDDEEAVDADDDNDDRRQKLDSAEEPQLCKWWTKRKVFLSVKAKKSF